MRALFLRHGESAHNAHTGEEPLSDELGDILTERGRAQAAAAGGGLREEGVTRLLTSPMRRATETAEGVGAALGLEPEPLSFTHELHSGETFDEAMGRVRLLKEELEGFAEHERPLLVTHGIFIRFFLFNTILGEVFTASMVDRIWALRSTNCGLSIFTHGETGEPDEGPEWACFTWMTRPWDPAR